MKIRTKLLLVFSPIFILLIIVVIIGRTHLANINELADTLEMNYNYTVLAEKIQRDIQYETISLRNLFIYENESDIQAELVKIEQLNHQIRHNIEVLSSLAIKEENVRIMEELSDRFAEFEGYENRIITAVLAGDLTRAATLMNGHGATLHIELQMLIGDLTNLLESRMFTLLENESKSVNQKVNYVTSFLAIFTVIITLFMLRFIWLFSSKLQHVSYVISGITKGKFDLSTKVQVTGKDEINEVAMAFNQMTTSLEKNTSQLEEKNQALTLTTQKLEEKAKELELSSKYKSEFLANMSHELRTPLNSMIILSRLLAENKEATLTQKQVEYSETIHTSTNSLHEVINEILEFSKIEYGNMKVDPGNVSLDAIAKEIELHFKPVAIEKGITYDVCLAEDVPKVIYTDQIKLKQVLRNLVANAIKFTEVGEVKLYISLASDSSTEPLIKFAVSDTGIGIAEENQELVFQAFQQEDAGTSRKYGGTGLGLSISKEMTNLLGGEISLVSEKGVGSTFSIFIPNYKDSKKGRTELVIDQAKQVFKDIKAIYGEAAPNFAEMRVLLIDDNVDHIYQLISILEEQGIVIEFAADGEEALERLEDDTSIDFIFFYVDYFLEHDFELINQIRAINFYNNTPILLITTAEQQEDAKKIISAGATDYIRKPIKVQQLFEVMQRYLNNDH